MRFALIRIALIW